MADNLNSYVHGDIKPKTSKAVATAVVIEKGDLVEQTAGVIDAADNFTWDTDLATTQAAFCALFFGVAQGRSRSGDTDPITVATSGVFRFTCAAATFEVGDLVGPAKATGNALENQKVVAVADEKLAIGRVHKRAGSNVTTVEVEIFSAVMRGLYELDT